ncbi:probable serine/threonine-protein kinase DDB_G0280133 [Mytilus trossulus]|uniref:probable serine/threonine-protein kinase DDB_G0280133 n=1 Tax=Mytilus trossulus TaxID=6551 RepID=UPI0030055C3D
MDTNGPLVGYSGCQSLRTPAAPSSPYGQQYPEEIDPAYGPHYVEYEPSDKPDLPSLDRSMSIQHDSTTMIEVQLNQQPRLVGEHCTEYESSTAMKEQHFENTHLNDRFQQSQSTIEQDFNRQTREPINQRSRLLENSVNYIQPPQPTVQLPVEHTVNFNQRQQAVQLPVERFNRSPPTVANQPINHRATGQQPPQPNFNRSNPLPALRSTPPVREREPYQQLPPTANRANQPPCPSSTGQLQSTRQQNYTFPVGTAGQQNRVIDNQQDQPPINHPVNISHINSHVPPTQQFNRTGLYQPNTNQSGFQQPLNNTMGQQGQTPQAIHNQQEFYRQQPVQHLQNVTAPIHQTQQPYGNIPY